MFWFVVIPSIITTVAGLLLDLVYFRDDYGYSRGSSSGVGLTPSTVGGGFTCLALGILVNWLLFWVATPPLVGYGWLAVIVVNLVVMLVSFGVANYAGEKLSLAVIGSIVGIVLMVGGSLVWNWWWIGSGNAQMLAHTVNVKREPVSAYPNTSDSHMVIVGDQAARFKAHQAMNTGNIGTDFQLGQGALQAVNGHMYYVFELLETSWTNTRRVHYTVPGYVVVDAENPNTPAKAKLGYNLHYVRNGWYGSNLYRHVYENGYSRYSLDDLTLEVNDNWKPFYTASIDKPAMRWHQSIPVGFIMIDPQSGKIQRYKLGHIPSWVDRVYSAGMAKTMLDWWGQWGNAPYHAFFSGNTNRYEVDGTPDLVYTDDGPAWQALITSQNNDTSIKYVALMDTNSNNVRLYTAPNGLITQGSVKRAFNKSKNNLKGLDPTNLALHKIYGQLTWVGSLVPQGTSGKTNGNYPQAESFSGVGLLNATDADGANVIVADTKGEALSQLSEQIANKGDNKAPGANSQIKTVQGTVATVNQIVSGGETFVVMNLEGDNHHIYRGKVDENDFGSLSMVQAKPGTKVIITFVDTGNPVRSISHFTNTSLEVSR